MQEGTTDRRGRWHPSQCTVSHYTPNCHTRLTLAMCERAAWCAVPQEHIQSLFELMPRRVAVVISSNAGYSGY
ncbi:hypothetical protein TNCV_39821 [Trichonephila clavipes]|nr:hypothetical protein TNCV_39821 [Trichonephila clavipes]